MTPQRYAEIQKAFLEIRELDQGDRDERLATLNQSDASLAEEVAAMLDAERGARSFIDKPLVDRDQRLEIETQDLQQPETDATSEPETPTHIGPYRILQKIGEGGHGVVFMAEQLQPIRRKVAIKWIKRGMDSDMILARFEAEWQALAMMKHPSIANVIEAKSTDSGQPYFVMELVHGVPIDEFCNKNHLSLSERLAIFQQVCGAVHHAHQKGIIHRDIKPANVLITTDSGKPLAKVIDFGIAKALHMPLTEKTMFTEYGQIVGTLEYMSPEQALMSQTGIDVRSDVYSLGVLLYLLLTGETPVSRRELLRDGIWELKNILHSTQPQTPSTRITSGTDPQRWRDHAGGESSWAKNVSGDLDWITMKAIAREPEHRYDSAADFSSDIDRFLDGDAIEARPPSRWYKFQKFVRRNRIAVTSAAVVGVSILASIVALWLGYSQSQKNLADVIAANELNKEKSTQLHNALEKPEQYATQLSKSLSRQTLETAWQSAIAGDYQNAKTQLEKIPTQNRNSAWNLGMTLARQYELPVLRTGFESNVRVLAVDNEANRIAIINTASQIEIWDAASLELLHDIQLPAAIYTALSFSDQDSLIAGSVGGPVVRVDLNNETFREFADLKMGAIRAAAYDKTAKSWWLTTGSNFLYQVSENELAQKTKVQLSERIDCVAVSHDGKRIAVGGIKGSVFVVDPIQPQTIKTFRGKGNEIVRVRFNGESMFTADTKGYVFEMPLADIDDLSSSSPAKLGRTIKSPPQPVTGTFGSDQTVFSAQLDGSIWWLSKSERIQLRLFPGAARELAWLSSLDRLMVVHPDGRISVLGRQEMMMWKHLADLPNQIADGSANVEANIAATSHTDGSVKTWNTTTGAQLQSIPLHTQEPLELDINATGSMLASVGLDKQLVLCRLPALEVKHRMKVSWGVRGAAFSPDGKLVAGPPAADDGKPNREGTIDIWDVKSGEPAQRLEGHKNWVLKMQFIGDDELASLSVDGTVKIWSVTNGECLQTIDFSALGNVQNFAVNTLNGEISLGHADGVVSTWDRSSAQLLRSTIVAGGPISGLSFADSECSILVVAIENQDRLLLVDAQLQTIASLTSGVGPIKAFRSQRSALLLIGKSGLTKMLKY